MRLLLRRDQGTRFYGETTMAKKKRYLRFTGIDVGKNRHVFCIRDAQANIVQKPMGFPNSCHGFEKLVNCLKPFGRARSMLIGMEATGHYWQSLHDFLCEQGFCVVVINPNYYGDQTQNQYTQRKNRQTRFQEDRPDFNQW